MKDKKQKTLVAYLCYVNDKNKNRRFDNFKSSLESLDNLDKNNCEIIAINNNCSEDVVKMLSESDCIDEVLHFNKNYWDVSVIFTCAYLADRKGMNFSCYLYDDFVVYDEDFIDPSTSFLNNNDDVGCVRITKYDFKNMHLYDSQKVPKSVNPESVRHYSCNHVNNQSLVWEGPYRVKNKNFYKNNWHYSSRPAIWKNKILLSFFDKLEDIPVMQPFEKLAAQKFYHTNLKTGVLDMGAVYTFLESERTTVKGGMGYNVTIKRSDIENEINKFLGNQNDK